MDVQFIVCGVIRWIAVVYNFDEYVNKVAPKDVYGWPIFDSNLKINVWFDTINMRSTEVQKSLQNPFKTLD